MKNQGYRLTEVSNVDEGYRLTEVSNVEPGV